MRYVIWHTPRVGSNMTMNMLHRTGVAGVRDYENCGFFLGFHKPDLEQHFDIRLNAYFANQRTPNGVEGCKASLQYFDELLIMTNREQVFKVLGTFEKAVLLSRRDKVAQAVSMLFGATQAKFSKTLNHPPAYNPDRIRWSIAKFAGMERRMIAWWRDELPILYYEDIVENQQESIAFIMNHLGIEDAYTWQPPAIKKQVHPLKAEYIHRYKETYGEPT